MPNASPPLAGVRVLDLSRILAGPVCTQILADLGADVVKVERPDVGDDTRQWGPPFLDGDGPSAYYLSCNRGKRSMTIDLATPAGRRLVAELVAKADVLVENFLPDAIEKFDLSHERLMAINPNLAHVSISTFGRTGPNASLPGYDLMIQAAAGLMSITGEREGMPMKVGVAITDVVTGLYAAISALAGLVARRGGAGGGGYDLALADCTLASLVNVAQSALVTGRRPQRWGNAHPQIVPYEAFATSDGHLVLAVGADRQWRRLCHALEEPGLADDPRYATNPARVENRRSLVAHLSDIFRLRATDEWLRLLTEAEVPHSPVLAVDEVLATPQVAARGMVREVTDAAGRRYRLLRGPMRRFDGQVFDPREPPDLGADTAEVLREWLGYDDEQVAAARRDQAIGE